MFMLRDTLFVLVLIFTVFSIFVWVFVAFLWRARNWPTALERFHALKAQGRETDAYICAVSAFVSFAYPRSEALLVLARRLLDSNRQRLAVLSEAASSFGEEFATLLYEAAKVLEQQQRILDTWIAPENESFNHVAERDWRESAFRLANVRQRMLEHLKPYRSSR